MRIGLFVAPAWSKAGVMKIKTGTQAGRRAQIKANLLRGPPSPIGIGERVQMIDNEPSQQN
jgi:hypothetical protein